MATLRADGKEHHPEMSATQASAAEATDRSVARLNADPNSQHARVAAAVEFWGFYYGRTEGMAAICSDAGVDISAYITDFKANQADVLQTATVVLEREGHSAVQMNEMMRDSVWPHLRNTYTNGLMEAVNSTGPSALADGCRYVQGHAAFVANAAKIQKINPVLYQKLSL